MSDDKRSWQKYIVSSVVVGVLTFIADSLRSSGIFSDAQFMPHGVCYLWHPDIIWVHAISDGTIALSYILITTFLFVSKTSNIVSVPMRVWFAVFIGGCGLTHVMDVMNIWSHFYWVDAAIRMMTAVASFGTLVNIVIFVSRVNIEQLIRQARADR